MATFTWTAKNRKTGAVGGRLTKNPEVNDVETMRGLLAQFFPNVDISELTIVEEGPAPEPAGTAEVDHLDTSDPTALVGGSVVRLSPVPPEDFQRGAAEAARRELRSKSDVSESPE